MPICDHCQDEMDVKCGECGNECCNADCAEACAFEDLEALKADEEED